MKQRAKCPVCGKKQKLIENRLVEHKDRNLKTTEAIQDWRAELLLTRSIHDSARVL